MSDFERKREKVTLADVNVEFKRAESKFLTSSEYKESKGQNSSKKENNSVKERPSKLIYDSLLIQEIICNSKRFKNLKPSALVKIIGEQPKYEFIKKIAVSRLEEHMQQELAIFSQLVHTKDDQMMTNTNEKLTKAIFGWRWDDFLECRNQNSFVWVDILLREKTNNLHYTKFQYDIKELQFFLNQIFQGFLNPDTNIREHIATAIDGAIKILHIVENLEEDFHENANELRYIVYKEYVFSDAKRQSEAKMLKTYLENRISNSHILDPIEIRYQLGWFDNLVEQTQYKIEKTIKEYEADIFHFKDQENKEAFINGNFMDYCYSSIELYKNRINEFQNKYDKDLEEMETKVTLLRLQIEKLKEQRSFLTSEIQRFHKEEEQLRPGVEENTNNQEIQQRVTLLNV